MTTLSTCQNFRNTNTTIAIKVVEMVKVFCLFTRYKLLTTALMSRLRGWPGVLSRWLVHKMKVTAKMKYRGDVTICWTENHASLQTHSTQLIILSLPFISHSLAALAKHNFNYFSHLQKIPPQAWCSSCLNL